MYVVFGLDAAKVDSDYFLHWLDSHEARERIKKSAQGSVRETVSFSEFASLAIPLPGTAQQTAITRYLNTLREEIALLGQSVDTIKQQKRGLMQKLLTGLKWRVKVPETGCLMDAFHFDETYLSQIPALQVLVNLGFEYLTPNEALAARAVAKLAMCCWRKSCAIN